MSKKTFIIISLFFYFDAAYALEGGLSQISRRLSRTAAFPVLMSLVNKEDKHTVKVRRLNEETLNEESKLIPINNGLDMLAYSYCNNRDDFLGKLYTSLTQHTGLSDESYDPFKGSFSFHFDLEVIRPELKYRYLLHLFQYRSFIRTSLYQVVPPTDPREHGVYASPDEQSFSQDNINAFGHYFYRHWMEREITPFPFVKCSPSNCMIYGFIDKYFKMNIYDQAEFDEKMKLLEKKVEKANKDIEKGKPANKRKCSRAPIESTDEDHDRDSEHTKTLFEQAKKEARAEGKKRGTNRSGSSFDI